MNSDQVLNSMREVASAVVISTLAYYRFCVSIMRWLYVSENRKMVYYVASAGYIDYLASTCHLYYITDAQPNTSLPSSSLLRLTTMRLSSFIPAASAFVFAAIVAAEGVSDVLDLKADTFESSVNAEQLILVEFFAPWSGP